MHDIPQNPYQDNETPCLPCNKGNVTAPKSEHSVGCTSTSKPVSTVTRSNRHISEVPEIAITPDSFVMVYNPDDCNVTGLATVRELLSTPGISPNTTVLNNPGHNLGNIPVYGLLPIYFDSNNTAVRAIANDPTKIATGFAVGRIGDDQVIYQISGFLDVENHGLLVGQTYYLSNTISGGITATAPTTGTVQELFTVIDSDTLLLNIN